MSPIIDDRTNGSSPESTCTQVRELLSSVVDGRATPAEEQFVRTHLPSCPGCASEMAFQRAMKAAWAKTPVEMPPASLSARIAAATYRKPTFAERFLAFLQPAPVRVAIGVAAVAGIAYFTLPRLETNDVPNIPPVIHHVPVVAQDDTAKPVVKKAPDIEKPTPPVAKATPQKPVVKKAPTTVPVPPAVEEPTTVAVAPTPKHETTVVQTPKPEVKKPVTPVVKPNTQVAMVTPKITHHVPAPTEHNVTAPEPRITHEPAPEVATATTAQPEPTPQTKEPPAVRAAETTVVAVADEEKPGLRLGNVNKLGSRIVSGTASFAANSATVTGIVSAPVK